MAKIKILVVDDEKEARSNLRRYLSARGFSVLSASEGSAALAIARETHPDIVVTDVRMPDMDGFALCRLLKKYADTESIPIIIISGHAVDDKSMVAGLEGGADDYVLKPVSLPVLLARIRAVLRRYEAPRRGKSRLQRLGVALDLERHTASAGGRTLKLTRKEFALLSAFVESGGRVLSHRKLLQEVWGYDVTDYNDPHTVEVHVSRLRKKLGRKIAARLQRVTGVGYKFEK